jgi:hypothetical protein
VDGSARYEPRMDPPGLKRAGDIIEVVADRGLPAVGSRALGIIL